MHNISNMLVLIGLCVMVISIFVSLKINKTVNPENKQKWIIITSLMVCFLIGYGTFFFLQLQNIEKYLELLVGLVFLGGALFVLLVMSIIQTTLASLESIFNNAIPLCITTKDFEILRANDAYYDVFGHPAKQSYRQKCFESRPGEDCHSERCPLARIMQGENEVVCDTTKQHSHKEKESFIVTARPYLDAKNEMIGIVESFQDISKRKRAENAKEELVGELQQALDEVNLLSGFLPICASCKKIRDDKGYWNQIESYIRDHSQVEFSHSICPDCAEELYPDLYKKNDSTEKNE
jgi:PAS domain S-box-containing protein